MGLPAVKREVRQTTRTPRLRVVDQHTRPARAPQSARKPERGAAYQAFVFFATLVIVVAGLGVGRVWLSVQAAQASIDCGKLQTAIKQARYQGDMLEIQASALSSPSRVQAIAQGQLGMAPATSVSYLKITPDKTGVVAQVTPAPVTVARPAMLDTLVGVAAAQARMLLVGDVGLASTR
jgi:cell division protein FtsL